MTEKAFFQANPSLGKFVHYPIIGSLLNPMDFPVSVRKVSNCAAVNVTDPKPLALEVGSFDNLPLAMSKLKGLLQGNYTMPAVIYIHCEAGKDRTGEISGSWYISQQNTTFNQVLLPLTI